MMINKRLLLPIVLALVVLIIAATTADSRRKQQKQSTTTPINKKKNRDQLRLWVEEDRFPFLHGVGSADPLEDSILLWTRVSPPLPWHHDDSDEDDDEYGAFLPF